MAVTDSEIIQLRAELAASNARYAEAERVNRSLRRQLKESRGIEKRLSEQVQSMRRSLSWRLTYPIRVFGRLLSIGKR